MIERSDSEIFSPDNGHSVLGVIPEKPAAWVPGDLICGRYRIISELGHGGMGIVFKCLDELSCMEVALKTIARELSGSMWEMESVKNNFKLVYNLNHPNIAAYKNLEYDPQSGLYYLIMEYVDGEDLRYYIRNKRKKKEFSDAMLEDLTAQIASALDYAHAQRIIHRDIKPGNIMVDRSGQIKVLDFGLAAEIHSSLSRVSMHEVDISGTLPYIAPEQWRGKPATAASDQYSLAVMTYEILSGHVPFQSSDKDILRNCTLLETPDRLEGVSAALNKAISKALSKEPAQRFESCSKFAEAMKVKINSKKASCLFNAEERKAADCPETVSLAKKTVPIIDFASAASKVKQSESGKIKNRKFIGYFILAFVAMAIITGLINTFIEYRNSKASEQDRDMADMVRLMNIKNFEQLKERAMAGSPVDQYNLARAYETGENVEQDSVQAIHWYTMAAEAGYPEAALRAGMIYESKAKYFFAAECYRKAAAQGNSEAQKRLNDLNKRIKNSMPIFNNNQNSWF